MSGSLVLAGSTNSWTGKLDLGGNDMDIKNGNIATMTNQAKGGYNSGAWNGDGIASTAAASDTRHLTALGVIQNSADGTTSGTALYGSGTALGLFDGVNTADTDVLIKYTWAGDANLSGIVDGTDYSRTDNGYDNGATGWYNGDYNYDGVVDGSDYTIIDNVSNAYPGGTPQM